MITILIDAPLTEKKTLVRELALHFRMNQSVVQHFPGGWPNGIRATIDQAKERGVQMLIVEAPVDSVG